MIDTGQHMMAVGRGLLPTPDHERYTQLIRDRYHGAVMDPFIFPAEISSDRLDAYFTRMAASTLRNYATDAATGVALMNAHRHMELPIGYSLDGEFIAGAVPSVRAIFYTVAGLRLGTIATDDLIRGIEAGLIRDVSVGFTGGDYICSICNRSLFDYDCTHIPGVEYDRREGESVTGRELAFAWIENARLSEVSVVYDGATPGAAILKATQEADAGRLTPATARILEARYRVKLPGTPIVYPVVTLTKEPEPMEDFSELRARLGLNTEVPEGTSYLDGVLTALDGTLAARTVVEQERDALRADLEATRAGQATLVAEAAMGRAYRSDLVTQALAAGVRAYGNDFDAPTYQSVLENASIDVIKRMLTDWNALGDRLLAGERQSADKSEPAPGRAETPLTLSPDNRAYRA